MTTSHERPLVVLTGATGGIGAAVAQRFIRDGYNILAIATHVERLQILRDADPEHIFPLALPVDSSPSVWLSTLMHSFDYYEIPPRVDILVCAHGYTPITTPSVQISMMDEFIPLLMTDLAGTFLAAQTVAPYMQRQQQGSMVFVTSLHAHQTYPARAAYAAAKAGIGGMARSLALEWGKDGITVNTVLPWQVAGGRTFRQAHVHEQATGEDLLAAYVAKSPLRQLVTEDDVADAVAFLARNRSCTGMELVLDTGVSASMWYKPF